MADSIISRIGIVAYINAESVDACVEKKDENRHMLTLFVLASVAIAMFYGAGLMYGRQTHMAIAEYWRWWVVHLWVEGF